MIHDDYGAGLIDRNPAPGTAARTDLTGFVQRGGELYEQGRYDEAAQVYQLVLDLEPHNPQARIGHNRAVRQSVPRWHWEMLHDQERADRYEQAIRQVVSPDRLILDVGAGSGLLSMLAARAGARNVVACEAQPAVARVAADVLRKAGYDEAVTLVPKMSTAMRVPDDLPRRADVLITETVDCGLLGEGILPTLAHARRHLLTDDAVILPSRGRVLAQLVESAPLHRKNYVGNLYGFDFSDFNRLSSIEYFDSRLQNHEHRMLSEPFEVFRFDFRTDGPEPRRTEFVVPPTAAGSCHAIAFWFELELVPGIELTNAPGHPGSHWKQAVQCLPAPVPVRPGEPLLLDASHDGVSVHFSAVGSRIDGAVDGAVE